VVLVEGRREPRQRAVDLVAMKMTAHKTEAVYRRYAIVNEADLHEAATKLGGAVPRMGTIPDTVVVLTAPVRLGIAVRTRASGLAAFLSGPLRPVLQLSDPRPGPA
jgi:hypothetical protein